MGTGTRIAPDDPPTYAVLYRNTRGEWSCVALEDTLDAAVKAADRPRPARSAGEAFVFYLDHEGDRP